MFDNRTTVTEAVIAKNGSYTVSLPAGTYRMDFVVHEPVQGPAVAIAPSRVRVVAGRTRQVNFRIDTGIR